MATPPPRPPSFVREPWLWTLGLALLPVFVMARRTALGEPFADDFLFLARAAEAGVGSLADGGGSPLFWRPLSRQLYFELLGPALLAQPLVGVAVHALALLASAVLVYRALRPAWPAAWCAAAASFPLLLESNRMLVTWPSHFQDVGALLFAALAMHEASRQRTATMAAAVACSLLCKEVAALAALTLPFFPTATAWPRAARIRAGVAVASVLAVWGLAYFMIARAGDVVPGYGAAASAPLAQRALWALGHSVRSAWSLPIAGGTAERAVAVGSALLAGLALVRAATARRGAKGRARGAALVLWGAAWWLAAALPLAEVHPLWSAQRAGLASVGLGIALTGLLAAADPRLLVPFAALRLFALLASPAGEGRISAEPPPGIEGDFAHVERLQRLAHETRRTLAAVPLPRGTHARVGLHGFPTMSLHALAGERSLQAWTGDSTLRWITFEEFHADLAADVAVFLEFEPAGPPQLARVETAALRAQIASEPATNDGRWEAALALLARADSLQRDTAAVVFRATVMSQRSLCLLGLGRRDEAGLAARRALELWTANPYSRFTLAQLAIGERRYAEADAILGEQLVLHPQDAGAAELRQRLRAALAGGAN